jgi:hypothetical protein
MLHTMPLSASYNSRIKMYDGYASCMSWWYTFRRVRKYMRHHGSKNMIQEGRYTMGYHYFLFFISGMHFDIPRATRIICACCEKSNNEIIFNGYSNSFFRLFLSVQASKKIETSDQACQKCRHKFDNWVKIKRSDSDDILFRSLAHCNEVNIYCV